MSYHLKKIPKGELGKLSKIQEELLEAIDAEEQGVDIMILIELSDVIGAIEAYLLRKYAGYVGLDDLKRMSDCTKRAFTSGHRKTHD
jgi:hypothetical protein